MWEGACLVDSLSFLGSNSLWLGGVRVLPTLLHWTHTHPANQVPTSAQKHPIRGRGDGASVPASEAVITGDVALP